MSEQELKDRLREIPLLERLERCQNMIGRMCAEGKSPKMTIPVQWDDEDFYICTTIRDVIKELATKEAELSEANKKVILWTKEHDKVIDQLSALRRERDEWRKMVSACDKSYFEKVYELSIEREAFKKYVTVSNPPGTSDKTIEMQMDYWRSQAALLEKERG